MDNIGNAGNLGWVVLTFGDTECAIRCVQLQEVRTAKKDGLAGPVYDAVSRDMQWPTRRVCRSGLRYGDRDGKREPMLIAWVHYDLRCGADSCILILHAACLRLSVSILVLV
jgi:hypothetical protein